MTSEKRIKILISGWYGNNNIGDETIIEGMLKSIREYVPDAEFVVFSDDPEWTKKHYAVDSFEQWPRGVYRGLRGCFNPLFWRYIYHLSKKIQEGDIFVLGGGGLLQHSNFGVVPFWLSKLLLAQMLGKPTMIYAIGVSKLQRFIDRFLTKVATRKTKVITVRDRESEINLREYYGVKKPEVLFTADPAFVLAPDEKPRKSIGLAQSSNNGSPKKIGIALLPLRTVGLGDRNIQNAFNKVIIETINQLTGMSANEVVLIVENHKEDCELIENVYSQVADKKSVSIEDNKFSVTDHLEFVSRLDALVSMRLHPLISAALVRTPLVGLIVHSKVKEFLSQVGQEDMGIPYEVINPETISNKIHLALNNRPAIIRDMSQRVEAIRSKALFNAELLKNALFDGN